MVRKLAVALASLALSTSTSVYALGLGNLELHSALNQPLNADIKLFSTQPAELDGMQIGLASNEMFEQAGVDRPQWLSQLKFSITKDASGQPRINVTSSQPVQEPFVTFLLEVNWSDGRLVREYTLLLDPPEFAQGRQVAVTQAPVVHEVPAETPRVEKLEPIPDFAPSSEATSSEASLSEASPSTDDVSPSTTDASSSTDDVSSSTDYASPSTDDAGRSYGPVKRNETLWSIASQLRPSPDISMEQMMLALVRLNPEAFNKGNVNRLKKGYVLRVPEADEIRSVAKAEAIREVRRQNAAWREYRRNASGATAVEAGTAAPAAKEPAVPPVATPPVEKPKGPRLKLVPAAPEKPQEATTGTVATVAEPEQAADGQNTGSLQEQLALAKETAAARGQESEELRGRLTELENQIAKAQRLIEIKDSEIAGLQNRLQAGGTEKPAGAPETPAVAEQQPTPERPKPVRVDAGKPVAKPPAPSAPVESDGLLAGLLNNPLSLLLGSLVMLIASALAWVAVRRRRMMNSGFQESILMPQAAVASRPMASAAATALGAESTSFLNDSMITGVRMIGTEVGETDPLAEADIYIAYGRYQQAEELISRALEKEPERVDLIAKLLEIHYGTKDRKTFEPLAQRLRALIGEQDPLWGKVVAMGRELCPESPLFGGTPSAAEVGQGDFEEAAPVFAETLPAEEKFDFGTQGADLLADNMFGSDADLAMFEPIAEVSAGEPQAEIELPALEFEFDKQGLDWSGLGASAPAQAEITEADSAPWQGAEEQKEELNLFSNFDEVGTKLDLARVYIDMGDAESAHSILDEVLEEGNEEQKREAQRLRQQSA